MLNNWTEFVPAVKKAFGALGKQHPKMLAAYGALEMCIRDRVNGRFEFESPCLRKSGKGCRYSQAMLLKVYRRCV